MLADDLGVSVDTVRYYERRGLLPARCTPTPATAATPTRTGTLAFILRAKEHGFTLKEIAGLLAHVTEGIDDAPAAVRAAAAAKLDALHEQRRQLDSPAARLERLDAAV